MGISKRRGPFQQTHRKTLSWRNHRDGSVALLGGGSAAAYGGGALDAFLSGAGVYQDPLELHDPNQAYMDGGASAGAAAFARTQIGDPLSQVGWQTLECMQPVVCGKKTLYFLCAVCVCVFGSGRAPMARVL